MPASASAFARAPRAPGVLLAILIAAAGAAAQAEPRTDFATLKSWLNDNNPELAAMLEQGTAARERIAVAGKLPDPTLRMELMELDRFPGEAGQIEYTVVQQFPLGGKRRLREREAAAEATAAERRTEQTRFGLHAQLRTALAGLYLARESGAIEHDVLALLRQFESIAQVRYANGGGAQQDVLKAQAERTMIDGRIVELQRDGARWQAELNALFGRRTDAGIELPGGLPPVPVQELDAAALEQSAFAASPELAAGAAEVAAAGLRTELADKEWIPDLGIGAGPVQVDEQLDSWRVMLEINLPLQFDKRRSMQRAARALQRAAERERQAAEWRLRAELQSAVAGFNTARHHELLFSERLLPQAELVLRSAVAAYRTGQVDFGTLIEAERAIRQARRDLLRAQVEQQEAYATIEQISGGTP